MIGADAGAPPSPAPRSATHDVVPWMRRAWAWMAPGGQSEPATAGLARLRHLPPALVGVIFAAEVATPLGFAHGALHLLALGAAYLLGDRRVLIRTAALAAAATLAGIFVSPPGYELSWVLGNRLLSETVLLVLAATMHTALEAPPSPGSIQRDAVHAQGPETEREAGDASSLVGRYATDIASLGGWRYLLDGDRLSWTPGTFAIYGIAPEQPVTLASAFGPLEPKDGERMHRAFTTCLETGAPYDMIVRLTRADGVTRIARALGEPIERDGAVVGAQGAFQDVTELVETRSELETARTEVAAVMAAISDGFVIVDADRRLRFVNDAAARLVARTPEELLGRSLTEVLPDLAGSRFERELDAAIAANASREFEARYPPLDRWFEIVIQPTPHGMAIHFRDCTELRDLSDQLRAAQKHEVLAQLTGGVAHDFNNLLTVILGSAELLMLESEDERLQTLAGSVAEAGRQGAALTNALLSYSRNQALTPAAVDVNALISSSRVLFRQGVRESVELDFALHADPAVCVVDSAHLQSALLNLLVNAAHAVEGAGTVVVETTGLGATDPDRHPDLTCARQLVIAVRDDGCGMPPEVVTKAFEPFFTTKEQGEGTGLGLSSVYGFVQQSGGHVRIESQPGAGTTVRVYLPLSAEAAEADEAHLPSEAHVRGRGEHVLVVEDDPALREHLGELLAGLGYRVTAAENGPRALEALARHPDVALLLTDMVMPGAMNGRHLAEAAQCRRPDLRVLYSSGYTRDTLFDEARAEGDRQLLAKPYTLAELARSVRSALDP